MRERFGFLIIIIAAIALASCSTTRVLQDDQYRLVRNKIEVTNDKNFNAKANFLATVAPT